MNTRSQTAKTIASQLSTGEFTTIETLNIPGGSRPSILKRPKVTTTFEKSKTGFSLQNIPKQISKETDIYPAASTAGDLIISPRKSAVSESIITNVKVRRNSENHVSSGSDEIIGEITGSLLELPTATDKNPVSSNLPSEKIVKSQIQQIPTFEDLETSRTDRKRNQDVIGSSGAIQHPKSLNLSNSDKHVIGHSKNIQQIDIISQEQPGAVNKIDTGFPGPVLTNPVSQTGDTD